MITVPQWSLITTNLMRWELAQTAVLATYERRTGGVVSHGLVRVRDGMLIVSGSISVPRKAAIEIVDAAKNGLSRQASVGVQVPEQPSVRRRETIMATPCCEHALPSPGRAGRSPDALTSHHVQSTGTPCLVIFQAGGCERPGVLC